LKFRRRKFDFC